MALPNTLSENTTMKSAPYLLAVSRLWWMAQVFRPQNTLQKTSGLCFGPGFGRLLRYESQRVWHLIFDRERWLWWKLRLRALFSRHERDAD